MYTRSQNMGGGNYLHPKKSSEYFGLFRPTNFIKTEVLIKPIFLWPKEILAKFEKNGYKAIIRCQIHTSMFIFLNN